MSTAAKQQGKPTFQEIAKRLSPEKLKRLREIKKAYPHIHYLRLPDALRREVQEILQSARTTAAFHQVDYSKLASVIGADLQTNRVVICQKDRPQGLYIIGTTGTGKSTLLANLILTDINQGLGVCLIEPHGDLTKTVLSSIPDRRLGDVILLDLMDSEYPFGFNIFEFRDAADINEVDFVAWMQPESSSIKDLAKSDV